LRRQLGDQVGNGLLQVHVRGQRVGVHAGAARIGDVLLPLHHARHGARHFAARIEQVDLQHHQGFVARMEVEHVLQRRVRDDAAVPVVVAVDAAPAQSPAAARRWP
jgi:hypothetical protein